MTDDNVRIIRFHKGMSKEEFEKKLEELPTDDTAYIPAYGRHLAKRYAQIDSQLKAEKESKLNKEEE